MIILPSPLLGKLGTLNVKYMHDFHLKGICVAIFCLDLPYWYPVIFTLCFTYSVHCPYWPPFPRGAAFHARRCRRAVRWSSRLGYLLCWLGELHCSGFQSFWYITFVYSFARLWVWRGPVPSSFTNVLLEVCGHYVGCIYMFWIMVWTWFVWDVRLYRGSLVGCVHHCVLCSGSLVGLRILSCFE